MTSVKFFGMLVGAWGEGCPRTARLSPEAPTSNVITEIGKTRPSPLINTDDTDQERDRVMNLLSHLRGAPHCLGQTHAKLGCLGMNGEGVGVAPRSHIIAEIGNPENLTTD